MVVLSPSVLTAEALAPLVKTLTWELAVTAALLL